MRLFLPVIRKVFQQSRHKCLGLLLVFLSVQGYSQTTVNWIGGVSTDYFTKTNWSNTSIDFANLTTTTLNIAPGSPYNPVLNGGNASNVNYRPAKINTLTGSNFTINGNLYNNGTDTLNGTITLNSPANFNIRNGNGQIGRNGSCIMQINGGGLTTKNGLNMATGTPGSNATVTVAGGSITVGNGGAGMDLNLASSSGTTAQLNITGGSVAIYGKLNIGTGGKIHISGLGMLTIFGKDSTAQLNKLLASGQLTYPAGKSLSIVYSGGNTTASIAVVSNSMLREYADSVVLNNGILSARIAKSSGNILSLKYKGVEQLNQIGSSRTGAYHDFQTSYGFETMNNCVFTVKTDNENIVDISLKRSYNPATGQVTPADADIHYVLNKGDTGLYSYSILEHKPAYPSFDLGSWRLVQWIAQDGTNYLCERIYVDSLRNWQMPSVYDFANASATGIAEIVKLNTGVRAGKYDGKYEYTAPFWDTRVWGHASNVNKIGTWIVLSSPEFLNGGPTHQDLNAAAGINHVLLNGLHYGDKSFVIPQGEQWSKIYGPYLMYTTSKATGDENWEEAKKRAEAEKAKWPYSWLTNTPEYPLANERGSVSGTFIIKDSLKPNVTGGNAWVGVTKISNTDNEWQHEGKNYHYWIKTNADGTFTIPNIRPGTYTFFAYSDGAVGDFSLPNVTVTAGGNNNLGNVTWNIARNNGKLIFQIGKPNRKSDEFKLGKFDYCEGFVERKYRDNFPGLIEYNTAENNWSDVLPYAHIKYPTTTFAPGDAWKWRINFNLPANVPATGNAKLTIAYASNDHAQQWIYVNNENSLFTSYYPANGDGNAFIRQANYAKYAYREVLIPMSKLKAGKNTITLLMPSNSAFVSHLMYDYISLEAAVPALSLSTSKTDAKCFGGSDGSITLNMNGGTPSYQVKLGADGVYAAQTSPYTFNNLKAGSYTVYVKDAEGTEINTTVTVGEAAAINLGVTKADESMSGAADASVTATFDGGTAPYVVKLNTDTAYTAQTSPYTFNGLAAGTYTVSVKDANGCEKTTEITIGVKTQQTITFPAMGEKLVGDADFDPGATASSGLTVTYSSSNTSVATIENGKIHIVGTGLTLITASQDGDDTYNAAVSVIRPLAVKQVFYQDYDRDTYGSNASTTTAFTVPVGYAPVGGDCNDKYNTVYPGAQELPDNFDNNCNGVIDEGLTLITFYHDYDRDGYGNNNATIQASIAPVGYVTIGGDCNDKYNTVYPGAEEVPDNLDNNCNGAIDEGLTLITFYHDYDRDGYGNNNATVKAGKSPGAGWITVGGDCNDKKSWINPGAAEIVNGIDDNCNGQVDEVVTSASVTNEALEETLNTARLKVSASPNPSNSSFTLSIRSGNDRLMQVRVLNILGSVVEQRLNVVPNSTIKLGGSYRSGIYFLEVVQGTERTINKLVKE